MIKHKKVASCSERILELMHEYDMSQTEFANKIGVNRSTISRCLSNESTIKQETIEKICNQFKCNSAWLMGYDVPMKDIVVDKLDVDTIQSITVGENADLWEIIVKLTQLSDADRITVSKVIDGLLAVKP